MLAPSLLIPHALGAATTVRQLGDRARITGRAVVRAAVCAGHAALLGSLLLSGCATRSGDVKPLGTDTASFADWPCDALYEELDRVQQRAADVAYAVDSRVGDNIIALSVGATLFWPALLAMRPDGPDAVELARLKGRYEALQASAKDRGCLPPADVMPPSQAASLPIVVGEQLVYEERVGRRGERHQLALRLSALRRGVLEFRGELDGRAMSGPVRQDRAGNWLSPVPQEASLYWTHLLPRDLSLGDVLEGQLHGPDNGVGRVRGQVVALGVQTTQGRPFDAVVLELFGDVPHRQVSTSVHGVMVVDRKSGVLLRLELNSANPDFELRRTLLRVDPVSTAKR